MSDFEFSTVLDERTTLDPTDLEVVGEDIFLGPIDDGLGYDMRVTDSGDLATVTRDKLARQSVVREMINNPGSFPRRPNWGAGLSGLLFKGATRSNRDRVVSRARASLLANPRVSRVLEVSTSVEDSGVSVSIRVDTIGGVIEDRVIIRPPGVS